MFDFPGFDPLSLSDEELLNRQGELSRRLGYAARFGSGSVQQLQNMIQVIENERRERVMRTVFEERQKMFPSVIESEPDLAEQKRKATEEEQDSKMVQRRKIGRERLNMTKTATPSEAPRPHFPQPDDKKADK